MMRRFFSFRSSSSQDNDKTPPPLPTIKSSCQQWAEADATFSGSRTPDDSISKSKKRCEHELSSPRLQRSLSFSSPAPFRDADDEDDSNLSPRIYRNPNQQVSDCPIHRHLMRHPTYFDNNPNNNNNPDSSFLSRIPLKTHSAHITNLPNISNFLDVYIEGEKQHEEMSNTNKDPDSLSKKVSALGLGKPPRPSSREANSIKEAMDFESETTSSVEDIYEDTTHDARVFLSNALNKVYDVDETLMRKAQAVDEILARLSQEIIELDRLNPNKVTARSLLTRIREINEDKRYLALELSTQIKSRLAERSDFKEKYRNSRLELEECMRQLEMERIELQLLDQERNHDRNSNDWSHHKVGKYELEEKRLRERVRELAEQNVAMQREISALKAREGEIRAKSADYEARLDEVRSENSELKQSLMEMTERFKVAEGQLGHFQMSYRDKEEETRVLHKAIIRLQRTCTDQEKSISSLLIHDKKTSGDEDIRYHTEITRLINVEQALRRELDSCRTEVETLRRENITFLERLNKGKDGNNNNNNCRHSFVRFEEEIRRRVDCLQGKGISLLDECNLVCSGLLRCMKDNNNRYSREGSFEGQNGNGESYSLIQYSFKCEAMKRGVEGLKRSLQCISSVLDEKSSVEKSKETSEIQVVNNPSEVMAEEQLKLELMINKILRENLFSKEKEIEQLQEEIALLVSGDQISQSEMQRMQDEISCLTYKTRDMEIQAGKREERINQLQEEFQETVKELTATRSMLKTAMEERDFASHEAAQLQKANNDLTADIAFLHKRIELLDEDLLLKDGQITILKESVEKPFRDDDLCFE